MSLCAAKRRLVGPMVRVITPWEREELLFGGIGVLWLVGGFDFY